MRISGLSLETPLDIAPGFPTVLEVQNPTLFGRVCQSLMGGEGEGAIEPYSIWDEDLNEINSAEAFLVVANPFCLPWDDRAITGALHGLVEKRIFEDFEARESIERLAQTLNREINRFGHEVEGDYGFTVEWDIRRYLKSFGFKPATNDASSLLDNLILFLQTCFDVHLNKAILFVNVKLFLSEIDLSELYRQAFFLKSKLFLLETKQDNRVFRYERKRCINLHLLES